MSKLWIVIVSVVFLASARPVIRANADRHYKEGQRLFGEKQYAAALEEFERADELLPDEPLIFSWIGASLHKLGQLAEAEDRVVAAIDLLKEAQQRAIEAGQPPPAIDLGYHTLLTNIRIDLGKYEEAVAAIRAFAVPDDGSDEAVKAKQAHEAAIQALEAKLVALGADCVKKDDLDCARKMLTLAESLEPAPPTVWEVVARDFLAVAERAPATTDEEKAARATLHQAAVAAGRLWVEAAGTDSPSAQHGLAKALVATKTREHEEEAVRILTALWETTDPARRDPTIQLDLAVAHAALEQWEQTVAAASSYIELAQSDTLGQGYCMRSYGLFQLDRCSEALADGERCKNPDGTVRVLRHVEVCEQRIARAQSEQAAIAAREAHKREARQAQLETDCKHLYSRVKWARSFLDEIPLEDVVEIIDDYKASEKECAPYLQAAEQRNSGNDFSSPLPVLCTAGAKTASFPLNLSMRSKEELEALRETTEEFKELCGPLLDTTQAGGVQAGLQRVEQALDRPH
jgi:tetratricopeptide (TPR) repeat protein